MCVKLTVALARRFGSVHLARLSLLFSPLLHPSSLFFLSSPFCRVSLRVIASYIYIYIYSLARGFLFEVDAERRLNGMAQKYMRARVPNVSVCVAKRREDVWMQTGVAASGQIAGGHEETDAR